LRGVGGKTPAGLRHASSLGAHKRKVCFHCTRQVVSSTALRPRRAAAIVPAGGSGSEAGKQRIARFRSPACNRPRSSVKLIHRMPGPLARVRWQPSLRVRTTCATATRFPHGNPSSACKGAASVQQPDHRLRAPMCNCPFVKENERPTHAKVVMGNVGVQNLSSWMSGLLRGRCLDG